MSQPFSEKVVAALRAIERTGAPAELAREDLNALVVLGLIQLDPEGAVKITPAGRSALNLGTTTQ